MAQGAGARPPALKANARTPHTESRKDYMRGLSLPELRAYVQGQLHAREHGPGVGDELRMIAEWVANSLIVAGIDGWQATIHPVCAKCGDVDVAGRAP